ncbi:MAG TPA: hypothetical protein VF764_04630 [Steroidobacteraceae bacterium]
MNVNKHGIRILVPHQPRVRRCYKKQHVTREGAFDHLVRLEIERNEVGLKVYRCLWCRHFHVGHPPEVKS